MFSRGERVEYTHYNSASDMASELHGLKGRVLGETTKKGRVLVEFDEDITELGGHAGDNGNGRFGHCLFIKPSYLTSLDRVQGRCVEYKTASREAQKEDSMSLASISRKVGRIARKFIDSDLVELIEAGLIDDNYEATRKGESYTATEYLLENKREIAKDLKAERKAEAKRRKGEDIDDEETSSKK
jgi:hypothetical protein